MLNGGLPLEDRECFFIILLVAYFTSSFRQDRSRIADSSSSSSDLGMDSDETYEPVLESDVSEIRVTCYCHHDPLPGRFFKVAGGEEEERRERSALATYLYIYNL